MESLKKYEEISSQTTTLDSVAEKHDFLDVDLIKIDTDGYDLEILRGADRIVTRARPVIQIEGGRFW